MIYRCSAPLEPTTQGYKPKASSAKLPSPKTNAPSQSHKPQAQKIPYLLYVPFSMPHNYSVTFPLSIVENDHLAFNRYRHFNRGR